MTTSALVAQSTLPTFPFKTFVAAQILFPMSEEKTNNFDDGTEVDAASAQWTEKSETYVHIIRVTMQTMASLWGG